MVIWRSVLTYKTIPPCCIQKTMFCFGNPASYCGNCKELLSELLMKRIVMMKRKIIMIAGAPWYSVTFPWTNRHVHLSLDHVSFSFSSSSSSSPRSIWPHDDSDQLIWWLNYCSIQCVEIQMTKWPKNLIDILFWFSAKFIQIGINPSSRNPCFNLNSQRVKKLKS